MILTPMFNSPYFSSGDNQKKKYTKEEREEIERQMADISKKLTRKQKIRALKFLEFIFSIFNRERLN